jgi:hypothetical protein
MHDLLRRNIESRDEKEELCQALTRLEARVTMLAQRLESEHRKKVFWIGASLLLPAATFLLTISLR